MPSPPPEQPGRRGGLRANLLPSAAVGATMGLLAGHEGSGAGVAVIVGLVGCAIVLGMLAYVNR